MIVFDLFNKEIKHVLRAIIAWPKLKRMFGRNRDRTVKTRKKVQGFHLLENSYKRFRGFHRAMKTRRTRFISIIKFLFSVLTE